MGYVVEKRFNLSVHRRHPVAHRRCCRPSSNDELRGRCLSDGRRTTSCCRFDLFLISCARSPNTPPTRVARQMPEVCAGSPTHQGAGGTQLRQDLCLPKGLDAPVLGAPHGEMTQDSPRNGLRCRRCRSRRPEDFAATPVTATGLVVRTVAHHSAAPR